MTLEDAGYNDIAAAFSSQEEATIALFERSAPSVVFITTSSLQQDRWSMDVYEIPQGSGSGFIWDDMGHIVTNYHVIENSSRFTVTLADQTSYEASVVGVEPNKDLAVLRIITDEKELRPMPAGNSNNLRVGQSVFAIGNPFGLDQSLTTGIISALGREIKAKNDRPIKDVIQTDAAINPGNSGGPLLDSSGKVIGVNTAIYSPSGASAGIGFSIPIGVVKWVVPDIIEFGEVRRPIIGIELVPQQYNKYPGSMIHEVAPGSPAAKAGLFGVKRGDTGKFIPGDLIVQINEYQIKYDLILGLGIFHWRLISVKFTKNEFQQVRLTLAHL
ncbi:UNVERIFIED_CONTAM: hypothetical protein GTU68_044647 [Idotea baltica]|nr:hypothetical protein [Idotea baltica]